MKRVIISPIVWAFVAGAVLLGCSKDEILDFPGSEEQSQTDDNDHYDNAAYEIKEEDEMLQEESQEEEIELIPITFNATVADWDDD